jgi:exodeoxyribonuclease VII large subunit
LILYPAVVQGIYAADSIVRGIQSLEKQDVDVIIVGRGGGSLEDLWAFNEEKVAQAIFDCSIPTISAVGHETDTTIADYVSDLRAPTPSAGAELAVYQVRDFDRGMERYEESLRRIMMRKITIEKNRIEKYKLKLLHASPEYKIKEHRMYVAGLSDRLQMAMNRSLQNKKYSLQLYIEKLKGLSPLEKLSSGYSVATTESGVVVTDVNQLEVGDKFEVAVKNGLMKAELLEKNIVERES